MLSGTILANSSSLFNFVFYSLQKKKRNDLVSFFRENNLPITDNQAKVFKYLLDSSNTGIVSKYKYTEFIKAFGPLSQTLDHAKEVFQEPFFYGYLSSKEAESLLITQPVGVFLMRLSRPPSGAFAFAVVTKPRQITHIQFNHNEQGQYEIYDDKGGKRFCSTLKESVLFYSHILCKPYICIVPLQPWFVGDLTAEEAEEFLKDQSIGTYLVRFSSQIGFFAATYKEPTSVKHVLIGYNLNTKTGEENCAGK